MLSTSRNIISSDATTQEMIAPVIDTLVATKAWSVGEEFIYAGTLYKVTTAIAVGATIVLGSGGNADTADTITEQISDCKIKSKTNTFITNSVGAIDLGTYVTTEVVICARSTNTNNYRLVPFLLVDGKNYLQALDNTWTRLPQGTSLTITYYYIKNA